MKRNASDYDAAESGLVGQATVSGNDYWRDEDGNGKDFNSRLQKAFFKKITRSSGAVSYGYMKPRCKTSVLQSLLTARKTFKLPASSYANFTTANLVTTTCNCGQKLWIIVRPIGLIVTPGSDE